MTDKMKLTLNPSSDNYQYIIDNIDSVDDRQKKPSTSIALPGQSYKDNILMGMGGQTSEIEVSFKIHNDRVDKADGSYSSQIVTISEQILYLKDTMQKPSFSASWALTDLSSENIYDSLDVFFENIRVSVKSKDSAKWRKCTLSFIVGESI